MKLHHKLWVEAMAIAKYMQNQIPTNGIFYNQILCVFGCVAFAHMLKKTKTKRIPKVSNAYSLAIVKKIRGTNCTIP
jgi:hypothetical protein